MLMQKNEKLTLSKEEMRTMGYRVIDMLIEHFDDLPQKPVTRKSDRPSLENKLRESMPLDGAKIDEVLDQLEKDVFSNIMHLDHPRFFAFVPSPSNFVGAMADALVSGFNIFAGTWLEASGPAQIELITLDWLRKACGFPETAGGLFVSGGSMANLTALLVARRVKLKNRIASAGIYYSDQTHSSIERALKIMGFRKDQMRSVKSDERFRMHLRSLKQMVDSDRSAGLLPFCVVANAGTTNTGAIDPLSQMARFCQDEDLWLHVDGAYGAAAVLCDRGRDLLEGLASADSLSLDPHKWLFQPYEIGCVIVRREHWLEDTFHILPEYLADIAAKQGEINFCDRGIQLTRMFRALKLWMTLKVFGHAAIQSAIERGFELAIFAEELVRGLLNWEVVTVAQMGILTFRYKLPGISEEEVNRQNQILVDGLIEDGTAMLSTTTLRGQIVLRMCTINPRSTEDDIFTTIRKLDELAKQLN